MRLISATTVQVKRYGEVFINEFGEAVVGTPNIFSLKCNWQPLANVQKGEIAAILPDGVKVTDVLNLWTKTRLKVDDEVFQTVADEVTIDGKVYKVSQSRDWNRYLKIKHYEYILIRKEKR